MANQSYPQHGPVGDYPIYTADEVIQRGMWIYNRSPFYSQGMPPYKGQRCFWMTGESFDCSSFIATITGYAQAYNEAPATPGMASGDYDKYNYQRLLYHPSMVLKKGDVLVWNWSGSATGGSGSDGHTGIYAGDGMFLHMTSPYPGYKQFSPIASTKRQ